MRLGFLGLRPAALACLLTWLAAASGVLSALSLGAARPALAADPPFPVLTCSPVTISTSPGTATAQYSPTPTAVTGQAPFTIVSTPPAGTFPLGTTTINVTVTDVCDNSTACTYQLTVADTEKPQITCLGTVTASTAPGQCSQVVTFATPAVSDNAPNVGTPTASQASGTSFPKGTTTVTWTVLDAAGNSKSCSFTVKVVDSEAPAITCPSNIARGNDPGLCGAVVTFSATVSDNCPGVGTPTFNPTSGSLFPIGTTTVTASVLDASGNASPPCSFTVTVSDTQAPVISCPANIVRSNDAGLCGAVVTFTAPLATDNCPGVGAVTLSAASGSFFAVGTTTVTASVLDAKGNLGTCSFTITVNDTQAPVISCPANIARSNDAGLCGAVVTFTTPIASDNCPGVGAVTFSAASGSFFALGTTTVTASVLDAKGNLGTCSFTVTVNDTQAPSLSCPANIVRSNDAGLCGAVVTFTAPVASDNCLGVGAVTLSATSGSFFAVGTTTVTASVLDAKGNLGTCSFTITVNDTQAPSLSCPASIVRSNDAGLCGAVVTFTAPLASDNCPGVGAVTLSAASGSFFAVGTTTVTASALDAKGNLGTCSFTITVNDTQAPSLSCPANIVRSNDAGLCGAAVTFATPGATDNCPGVGAVTLSAASGSFFALGTTTVTASVLDAKGNLGTCSFTITVNDTQAPSLSCPANIVRSNDAGLCGAVVTFTAPLASDNCPGVGTVTLSAASGSFFAVGTTTVTASVLDAKGNLGTCSFTITVNDTQAPSLSCPANIVRGNDAGLCGAVVTFTAPLASDNCPGVGAVTLSAASGSFFAVGTTTVTASALDAKGNLGSCSFTITVNDTQAPSLSCPANIVRGNDAGLCGAVVTFTAPLASDNCPGVGAVTLSAASGSFFAVGTTTVTASVLDAKGNLGTCSFTVTVNDTQAPSLSCPANIVRSNDAGLCGAVVTFTTPGATDNCPGVGAVTLSAASGSFFAVGTTTVTASVLDAKGNLGTCSFTVTVNDTQAPSLSCPANIVRSNDAGLCGAVVTFTTPGATDNCPGVGAVTLSAASGSFFAVGTTTVTASALDAKGNLGTCSFTITVNDTQAPALSCPANIAVANDAGQCGATVSFATPGATDNCPGTLSVSVSPASGSFFAVGTATVTASVTDAAGNSTSCSFTVTVSDAQAPSVTTTNVSKGSDAGACGAVVTYAAVVADNCPGAGVSLTPASGSFFALGATTVTALATDAAGNTTSSTFTVTVADTEPPSITCPADVAVSTDAGECGAVVTFAAPQASDNCPGAPSTVYVPASGSFFPVGSTIVVATTTDAAGNTSTCQVLVAVTDDEAPVITPPASVTVTAAGAAGLVVDYTAPVVTDNCPGAGAAVCTPASGSIFPVGTTHVTCTASDAAGNVTVVTFDVTVQPARGGGGALSGKVAGGGLGCSVAPLASSSGEPARAAGTLLPLAAAALAARLVRRRRPARA